MNNGTGSTSSFIWHLHPRTLPESTLRFNHTFGLGGMALLLFVVQIFSGVLLRFVYQASPAEAYHSILLLQNEMLFGQFIRNIHYWSGSFLVMIVFLHLFRVYFSGAFYSPRQLNWLLGLLLLFLTVLSNFTGYLLPWDQRAYWATTISTGMLEYIPLLGPWLREWLIGGEEIGGQAMLNFYTLHTAIFPFLIIFVMSFHFWRVRKAGGVVVPSDLSEKENAFVPAVPNLVVRELAVALVLLAVLFMTAALFNAPLQAMANPALSPNPTKAAWYFMGLQELLLHFHPLLAASALPLAVSLGLVLLPYLNYPKQPQGIWFVSDKGRQMAWVAVLCAVIVTPLYIVANAWLPDVQNFIAVDPIVAGGVVPAIVLLLSLSGFYYGLKKRFKATLNETVQALFVLITVIFLILTITGIWFRGADMQLVWPWQIP